ncbi:hypothetical protein AX15_006687 [Amanita polypyramis BW_CC]|nr:hypothetical protein AX15_006687 [Amanita polypyramis BW_CC]
MAGSSALPLTPQCPSKQALPKSSNSPDSPSKNTQSQNPVSNSQLDKSDEEIIAEARKKWKSDVYNHYNVSLEHVTTSAGKPQKLRFVFTCHLDPKNHVQHHDHMATSQGTTNIQWTNKQCFNRQGVKDPSDSSTNTQQDLHNSVSHYTPS